MSQRYGECVILHPNCIVTKLHLMNFPSFFQLQPSPLPNSTVPASPFCPFEFLILQNVYANDVMEAPALLFV
jgi:hypothetical protein